MSPSRINVRVKVFSPIPEELGSSNYGKVPDSAQPTANGTKANLNTDSANSNTKFEFSQNTETAFPSASPSPSPASLFVKLQDFAKGIKPYWALLLYPSDLHYGARTFVMTLATTTVIYETVCNLTKDFNWDYDTFLRESGVYWTQGPQRGRVGLAKDIF